MFKLVKLIQNSTTTVGYNAHITTLSNMKTDIYYIKTKDDLRLMGIHYDPKKRDKCVLLIHGMSGNIIENYFGHVLGETFANQDIGYIYCHNRGYNFINDIATSNKNTNGGYKTTRHGATYELFGESPLDINAWVEKARELGYKNIILMGHSLGCNKIVHYIKTHKPKHVTSLILASPPDMVGSAIHDCGSLQDYKKLIKEAQINVKNGNPRKLLNGFIFGEWIILSSQTFLDASVDNSPGDVFPIMRNPEEFPELAEICLPILCLVGENDEILLKPVNQYFDILENKAQNCPKFTRAIIKNANHTYDFQEKQLADSVLNWMNSK